MSKFIVKAVGHLQIEGSSVKKSCTWELAAGSEIAATQTIQTREEIKQWPPGTTWQTQEVGG